MSVFLSKRGAYVSIGKLALWTSNDLSIVEPAAISDIMCLSPHFVGGRSMSNILGSAFSPFVVT